MAMISHGPLDLTLELAPRARFDVVELRSRLSSEHATRWRRTRLPLLVRPHHRRLPGSQPDQRGWGRDACPPTSMRSGASSRRAPATPTIVSIAGSTSTPPSAPSSRKNADSHLAYIAGGLRQCVTHPNRPGRDGVLRGPGRRQRRAAAPAPRRA